MQPRQTAEQSSDARTAFHKSLLSTKPNNSPSSLNVAPYLIHTLLVSLTADRGKLAQMVLQRERLEMSPVFSTAMQHDGHRLGYIRLASFSQKAASDMRRAIDRLEVCFGVPKYKLVDTGQHVCRQSR